MHPCQDRPCIELVRLAVFPSSRQAGRSRTRRRTIRSAPSAPSYDIYPADHYLKLLEQASYEDPLTLRLAGALLEQHPEEHQLYATVIQDERRLVLLLCLELPLANGLLTWWRIKLGPSFYGYGYALALLITLFSGLALLDRRFRQLEYRTFMLQ